MNDSGLSHRRISIDTGINRTCLRRFREGLPLTTDNADKLAAYLGMTLTQPVGDSNPCNGTENPGAYAEKPNKNGGIGGQCTSKGTLDDAKTSQIDGIREALAAMSKDDLIALLADALADGGEPSTTGDNGNG